MRVQDGALYFAKMTGAPIRPVCFSASRSWFQDRWVRYLVALPFSRIVCKVGEPIFVDSKISRDDFENLRHSLENIMVSQVRELDKKFNLMQVEQDSKSSSFKKMRRAQRAERKNKKRGK